MTRKTCSNEKSNPQQANTDIHSQLLTNREFCALLRSSEPTIWRKRKMPGFPQPGRFGRRLLWDYPALELAKKLISDGI